MIWAADKTGHTAYVCAEWFTLTGQPPEQACGYGWLAMVHPEDRGLAERTFASAVAQQASYTTVYRLRTAEGSYIWVKDSAMPSFAPHSGELLGYLGTLSRADDEAAQAGAQARLGVFDPAERTRRFQPLSPLDQAAYHLMHAHAAAQRANDSVLQKMIEISLRQISLSLSRQLSMSGCLFPQ